MDKYLFLIVCLFIVSGCNSATSENKEDVNEDNELVEEQEKIKEVITVEEFHDIYKNPEIVILDIRSDAERNQGYIVGSELIVYNGPNFQSELESLDKSKRFVLYCASGGRSGRTLNIMKEMGFEKVSNLQGGIMAWQNSGYPVVGRE